MHQQTIRQRSICQYGAGLIQIIVVFRFGRIMFSILEAELGVKQTRAGLSSLGAQLENSLYP